MAIVIFNLIIIAVAVILGFEMVRAAGDWHDHGE
jgi:hypothetical protein